MLKCTKDPKSNGEIEVNCGSLDSRIIHEHISEQTWRHIGNFYENIGHQDARMAPNDDGNECKQILLMPW